MGPLGILSKSIDGKTHKITPYFNGLNQVKRTMYIKDWTECIHTFDLFQFWNQVLKFQWAVILYWVDIEGCIFHCSSIVQDYKINNDFDQPISILFLGNEQSCNCDYNDCFYFLGGVLSFISLTFSITMFTGNNHTFDSLLFNSQ